MKSLRLTRNDNGVSTLSDRQGGLQFLLREGGQCCEGCEYAVNREDCSHGIFPPGGSISLFASPRLRARSFPHGEAWNIHGTFAHSTGDANRVATADQSALHDGRVDPDLSLILLSGSAENPWICRQVALGQSGHHAPRARSGNP